MSSLEFSACLAAASSHLCARAKKTSCEYVQYVIHVMYLWGTPSFQLPGFSETKPCRFRPPEEFGFRDMASQAVLMVLGLSCHSVATRGTKSTTDNTEKRTCQMYIYIYIYIICIYVSIICMYVYINIDMYDSDKLSSFLFIEEATLQIRLR